MVPTLQSFDEARATIIWAAEQGEAGQITFITSHSASEMRGSFIYACKRIIVDTCKHKNGKTVVILISLRRSACIRALPAAAQSLAVHLQSPRFPFKRALHLFGIPII